MKGIEVDPEKGIALPSNGAYNSCLTCSHSVTFGVLVPWTGTGVNANQSVRRSTLHP